MKWFYSSLKNRFYISILALVVFSLVVIGTTTFYFFKSQNTQYHLKRIQRKERTVTSSLQYFLNDLNPSQVNEFITKEFDYKVREISDVNSLPIIIYNLSGELLINTNDTIFQEKFNSISLPKKLLKKLNNEPIGRIVQPNLNGDINSYSYAFNKMNQKMVIINSAYHTSNFSNKTELWGFLERLLTVFFLLFLGAGILAYFLSTYITKSLAAVSQKIKSVEIGDNNERLNWKNNDEIGILVTAYNEMLNKLEISKEQLAQNERQNAWREMAKQVAHEIKNPLTPMKLSVQHLSRSLLLAEKSDEKTIKDFQSKMVQQINVLSEIADEFSNYAELPKGNMKEVDLLKILKKIINLFKHENQVIFKLNINNTNSFKILGDENQLIRVFNNLIQNSLQAMHNKGLIEINCIKTSANLVVHFMDDGPGIPLEIHQKIFEPKFTTKSKGKGLGLALVWQIISNHNAKISISSNSKGAHFIISFNLL
jgi:two-component system nitrogen regulation sensor histidine kinase NtrY